LLKKYEAIAKSHAIKADIHFCLDEEDNFKDEIDDHITAELEFFKSPLIFNHLKYFVLLAAALRALFWCLKQSFPQNNGPSHSSSPNVVIYFLQQFG